jgi:hypothetical protein
MWYNRKKAQTKFINKLYFVDRVGKEGDSVESINEKTTGSILERQGTITPINSNSNYSKD